MTATIEFGTTLRSPRGIVAASRRIEALGFDVLGVGEHVSFHGENANGFISLAVAAGATTSIRLMSTITLVPLYPAALLAKLGAALDVASDGRFVLGVGVGGEFPKEFEACGVPVHERGARANEALEVIDRVWRERGVSFEGRFTRLDDFSLDPLPVQKPRPPIWVSGRSEAAMRRAARFGDGWLPYMYTPEQLASSNQTISRLAGDAGRDRAACTPGLYVFTAVHEDGARAVEMATRHLSQQYAQDFSRLVPRYVIAGDPHACRARLARYVDAGARLVVLSSACDDDYLDTNLQLIASEIIPGFRRAGETA